MKNQFNKKVSPLDFFYKKEKITTSSCRKCDYPGCKECGEYKAPKNRHNIRDYYWFCSKHISAYNKSWNYYEGMSETEIELDRRNSLHGDRPTWNQVGRHVTPENLLKKVFESFGVDDDTPHQRVLKKNTPELKALLDLGLQPPVSFKDIKIRYRKLVKQYHPDVNKSDVIYEEKIKKINVAYQTLKKVYG